MSFRAHCRCPFFSLRLRLPSQPAWPRKKKKSTILTFRKGTSIRVSFFFQFPFQLVLTFACSLLSLIFNTRPLLARSPVTPHRCCTFFDSRRDTFNLSSCYCCYQLLQSIHFPSFLSTATLVGFFSFPLCVCVCVRVGIRWRGPPSAR